MPRVSWHSTPVNGSPCDEERDYTLSLEEERLKSHSWQTAIANAESTPMVKGKLRTTATCGDSSTPKFSHADNEKHASLLRAMRRLLNLTQREFGILLSPKQNNMLPLSASQICHYEAALQAMPMSFIGRAIAATTAVRHYGEYLGAKCGSGLPNDTASALKALGPGCSDGLEPYLLDRPKLSTDEGSFVRDFLNLVSERSHNRGGARVRCMKGRRHPPHVLHLRKVAGSLRCS